MKKRNSIPETLSVILLLLLLPCFLSSCSKPEENNDGPTIQVDLTDTTFHHLLHKNGYWEIGDIIVGNTGTRYMAASAFCPACMNRTIIFQLVSHNGDWSYWSCQECDLWWDAGGTSVRGALGYTLKVFNITKSGNILTIHL